MSATRSRAPRSRYERRSRPDGQRRARAMARERSAEDAGQHHRAVRPAHFALVFVPLVALPALPLPTGGATHVLEVVTMLVALQLVVGRRRIWRPARWLRLQLAGPSREKLLAILLRRIRWLERFSRPRASWLFDHIAIASVFGLWMLPRAVSLLSSVSDATHTSGAAPGDDATRSHTLGCGPANSARRRQRPRAASPVASSRWCATAGGGPASAAAYRSRLRCAASASRTGG
jgi:hypothetical protein